VVDFIHLSFFSAIFNFADCCVTLGASILSVVIIISMVKEHQENRKKQAETPEES
jgi:signal peptidase II